MSASTPSRSNAMRRDIGRVALRLTVERLLGSLADVSVAEANANGKREAGGRRASEESIVHEYGVVRLDDIRELGLDFLLVALHDANDFDTAHGPTIRHATGERERLQNGRVLLLERVSIRILHLTRHIHAVGFRNGNRIAVPQHDVLLG